MPKKFVFINDDNQKTEGFAYEVSEYVTTATPDSPVVTGPDGTLDQSLIPSAAAATKLKITRIANEDILAGEVVRAQSGTHVSLATGDDTFQSAQVLGIAENSALTGETVDIILLGVITNAAYSIFAINSPLFLDVDGGITDTKRTDGFHVIIGKALGSNDILIQPSNPTAIA